MTKLKINEIDILDGKAHYFKINKEDANIFFEYGMFIEKLIRHRKPIPKRVFDKYMNYLVPIQDEVEQKYNSMFEEKFKKLKERFLKQPSYQFSYTDKSGKEYSLELMLEEVLNVTLNHYLTNEHTKGNTKDNLLKISYCSLLEYVNMLDSKRKKNLKPNKLTAISAYILILFGFGTNQNVTEKINAGERPTNDDLFKSIWHHTKKIEIEKRK